MAAHCVAAQHIICKQPQHQGTWLQPLQNNPTKICGHRVEKHRETTAAAERNLDAATPVRSANAELQKSKDLRAQPLQQRAMNQAPQCDLHTLICKLHQTATQPHHRGTLMQQHAATPLLSVAHSCHKRQASTAARHLHTATLLQSAVIDLQKPKETAHSCRRKEP